MLVGLWRGEKVLGKQMVVAFAGQSATAQLGVKGALDQPTPLGARAPLKRALLEKRVKDALVLHLAP